MDVPRDTVTNEDATGFVGIRVGRGVVRGAGRDKEGWEGSGEVGRVAAFMSSNATVPLLSLTARTDLQPLRSLCLCSWA